jgi:hypothetical protein
MNMHLITGKVVAITKELYFQSIYGQCRINAYSSVIMVKVIAKVTINVAAAIYDGIL